VNIEPIFLHVGENILSMKGVKLGRINLIAT